MKKKKHTFRKIILSILSVLLVAALVIVPFALEKLKEISEDKGSLLSAQVSLASISKTVSGAGTLADEEAVEVKLPYGVEVTKYLVANNDFVTERQDLVSVDRISVMNSIYNYQKDIEYVESQMAQYTDTGAVNFITTASRGCVMELYAKAGDSINDVMLEHGALAVLSLDGLLAVDADCGSLPVGCTVGVQSSDGAIVPGHLESKKNGISVITLDQYGQTVGDNVNILNTDYEVISSGTLYIHSPLKITGYAGTVEAVHIKLGQDLSKGATLFSYSGNSSSAEYGVYSAKHTELTGYVEQLFKMYTDGTVKAECAGIVSGIDKDAAAELLSAESKTGGIELLADVRELSYSTEPIPLEMNGGSRAVLQPVVDYTVPQTPYFRVGKILYAELDENGEGFASYSLSENTFGSMEEVVYSIQQSEVDLRPVMGGALTVPSYCISSQNVYAQNGYLLISYNGGSREPAMITMINSNGEFIVEDESGSGDDGQNEGKEDDGGKTEEYPGSDDGSGFDTSGSGKDFSGSFSVSGDSMSGMMGSSAEKAYSYYSTRQTTVMSVTPQDQMTVDITIDELDILSIKRGQEVQITLDALIGQSFDGTITDIGVSGSNSGGNTKYTAEVTVPRALNMLAGMNVTALITLSTSDGLLTLPSEAIECEGTKEFVYTGFDSKTETLIDPVYITTGVSDGIRTEIRSGLSEGDTVWYSYLDTLDSAFSFDSMPMPPQRS